MTRTQIAAQIVADWANTNARGKKRTLGNLRHLIEKALISRDERAAKKVKEARGRNVTALFNLESDILGDN